MGVVRMRIDSKKEKQVSATDSLGKTNDAPERHYPKCKWNHSLDDAVVYGGLRYCKTCRAERNKYNWYRTKCRRAGVTENVMNWQEWAKELWGGPYPKKKGEFK